jgi:pimeloyl-ACP methyl ester carboxylesterase
LENVELMKKLLLLLSLTQLQQMHANWHTIYAHGIVDGPNQMQRFESAINTNTITAAKFIDSLPAQNWDLNGCIGSITSALIGKNVNRVNMHMGQGADIATLYETILNVTPEQNLILYGCSRGSATIINYLALHNPSNLKAIVLDATPANIPETIAITLAQFGINPTQALDVFCKIFPAYQKTSIPPIHAIKNIKNKNLPILLIHSQTDQRVHVQNAYQLYQEFKAQGFLNVHLVILPDGQHSFLLQNDSIKALYLKSVNQFYKKYNLPYDLNWIDTNFDMNQLMPSSQEMQLVVDDYAKKIIDTYKFSVLRNTVISTIMIIMIMEILIQKYLE